MSRKEQIVCVRLSDTQYQRIREMIAKENGQKSISAYIRFCLDLQLDQMQCPEVVRRRKEEVYRQILYEIRKIRVYMNQIVVRVERLEHMELREINLLICFQKEMERLLDRFEEEIYGDHKVDAHQIL